MGVFVLFSNSLTTEKGREEVSLPPLVFCSNQWTEVAAERPAPFSGSSLGSAGSRRTHFFSLRLLFVLFSVFYFGCDWFHISPGRAEREIISPGGLPAIRILL